MGEGFWSGFLAGLIVALLFGVLGRFIRRLLALINAPNKPQVIPLETKKTPAQVVAEAQGAWVRLVFTGVLIAGITLGLARLLTYLLGNA